MIGNSSWAYDSDKGWIPTGKPNPDPLKLTKLIPPGEIGGVKYTGKQNGTNNDIYTIAGAMEFDFYIDRASGRLMSQVISDGTGVLSYVYDYQTPVSISPPL